MTSFTINDRVEYNDAGARGTVLATHRNFAALRVGEVLVRADGTGETHRIDWFAKMIDIPRRIK